MLRLLRAHVRQNVVGYIALFFAMTGTASAAAAMWTGENIKDGTLTGADVADGSLTASDMAASSGGGAPLLTFDSGTQTYTGPAFANGEKDGQANTPVTSITLNVAKAGFVEAFVAGTARIDGDASCPSNDSEPSGYGSGYLLIDDVYMGGFDGTPNAASQAYSRYLTAGDHTVKVAMYQFTCAGPSTGTYSMKDVHVLVTSP